MKLILFRGLPGSGKSTAAKKLDCLHLEADMWHQREGVYTFDAASAKDAHAWCLATTMDALSVGMDVCVSNTFTQKWELDPYLDMAKALGARVVILKSVHQFGTKHNVPEEVMRRMADRWEDIEGEVLIK